MKYEWDGKYLRVLDKFAVEQGSFLVDNKKEARILLDLQFGIVISDEDWLE
jgi:hypothetical protein